VKLRKKNNTRIVFPDKSFLYLVLVLVFVGLVFVADISAPQSLANFDDKYYYLKNQSISAIIGIIVMILLSNISYTFWKKIAIFFFAFSIFLLIAVLIPGLSYSALGARRWILIGGINFQPSEILKLSLSIYLAKVADSKKKAISFFIPILLSAGLVMFEPDLGTTLIVLTIGFSQIIVAGIPLLKIILGSVAGIISVLLLIITSPYRRDRLMTFLKVTSDPLDKEYHIRQILLAIGSGGLWGVGLGQSRQKYLFLPEAANDSIFAAISEEIGFIGSFVLIIAFIFFFYKSARIALRSKDVFGRVLGFGIVSWISGQALLNFSSMVALGPLTGIPLPFFSYGGTNLIMVLAGCGILMNISKYSQTDNFRLKKRK